MQKNCLKLEAFSLIYPAGMSELYRVIYLLINANSYYSTALYNGQEDE